MLDLQSGNIHYYVSYLKDIVDEECDLSVRAGILMERLKGDKMLHHFQGKIEIGTGNGGIISQLKMQNEMKLTDESWISYQQGKGNEEYQKYMEDLTDMQNHVLPYLQSFCSLEGNSDVNAAWTSEVEEQFEYMYRLFFFLFLNFKTVMFFLCTVECYNIIKPVFFHKY